MKHYVGIDLHSDNAVVVGIDETEKWILKKKLRNSLNGIITELKPIKSSIEGVVVEATYNWYWLVDGLMDAGFKVLLAHPGGIEPNRTKKHTNDYDDAFHLAHLLRMNNLPQGYIYPKAERSVRDLLRKRSMLVKKKTDHLLSLINLLNRHSGVRYRGDDLYGLTLEDLRTFFEDDHLYISARATFENIEFLAAQIHRLEKTILLSEEVKPQFRKLKKIDGIGNILALTIELETGNINRFKTPGDYVSYCRGVGSKRLSNGKNKGENNRKSGNKYLAWAFVEAANFSKRKCPYAKAFYDRKLKQSRVSTLAIKALASKLARAAFYIMRDNVAYDIKKIFPNVCPIPIKCCGSQPKQGTGQQPTV